MKKMVWVVVGILFLASLVSAPSWAKDILIGLDGPLSGPAASFGLDAFNAVNLAVEEINAAGGIKGDKLKVIAKDSMTDPTKARANAEELIYKDGVVAFFASTLTTNNLASLEVTTKGKVRAYHCRHDQRRGLPLGSGKVQSVRLSPSHFEQLAGGESWLFMP